MCQMCQHHGGTRNCRNAAKLHYLLAPADTSKHSLCPRILRRITTFYKHTPRCLRPRAQRPRPRYGHYAHAQLDSLGWELAATRIPIEMTREYEQSDAFVFLVPCPKDPKLYVCPRG